MTQLTDKPNETASAKKPSNEPQGFTCPNCGFNPKEHAERVKKDHGKQAKA